MKLSAAQKEFLESIYDPTWIREGQCWECFLHELRTAKSLHAKGLIEFPEGEPAKGDEFFMAGLTAAGFELMTPNRRGSATTGRPRQPCETTAPKPPEPTAEAPAGQALTAPALLGRATILKGAPGKVRGNTGRGYFVVVCVCGYRNNFDALSWGGHGKLRCKARRCRNYIYRNGEVWASPEARRASRRSNRRRQG